jgi:hypothetical protein
MSAKPIPREAFKEIKEQINELSQADLMKKIPIEFFQNVLFSIRLLSEYGLRSAIKTSMMDTCHYFIDKIGNEKFTKLINSLSDVNPNAPNMEWKQPRRKGWPKGKKRKNALEAQGEAIEKKDELAEI